MKRWQFALLMVFRVACVCLAFVSIVFARQNQKLQAEVQAQQVIINKGALSQQIGANLLREIASVAATDEKMKKLLQESGYNMPANSAASPSPLP